MSQIAIIVKPENLRRKGPIRFPVLVTGEPTNKIKGSNASPIEMTMAGDFFAAGTHFLTPEQFDRMKENPHYEWALAKGIIEPVNSTVESSEEGSGTTADFNLAEAYKLIGASVDLEWLKTSQVKDERKDVVRAIRARIKEINETMINNEASPQED